VKVYKQRIIHSYVADFYCAAARLVVELDGSQHYEQEGQKSDRERDADMEALGLKVLRFSNREIQREFDAVCEAIHQEIQARTADKGR